MRQYDKFIARLRQEIERTDFLINSLKRMPPVVDADSMLTSSDSILIQAIDSLAAKQDSLLIARNKMDEESINIMEKEGQEIPEEEEENQRPLYLTGQQLRDRNECLQFADTIRNNLAHFLESIEAENAYYQSVHDKVMELDEYAQSRYRLLQENIFRNGGHNYFSILASLPMQVTSPSRDTNACSPSGAAPRCSSSASSWSSTSPSRSASATSCSAGFCRRSGAARATRRR